MVFFWFFLCFVVVTLVLLGVVVMNRAAPILHIPWSGSCFCSVLYPLFLKSRAGWAVLGKVVE